jgi:hypothetical protein
MPPDPTASALPLCPLCSTRRAVVKDRVTCHDGSLSTQVGQLFFDPLNQDWDTTSAALLNADQAYEGALASGSGLDAVDSSLSTADFQALGDFFNSMPVIDIANLINLF